MTEHEAASLETLAVENPDTSRTLCGRSPAALEEVWSQSVTTNDDVGLVSRDGVEPAASSFGDVRVDERLRDVIVD